MVLPVVVWILLRVPISTEPALVPRHAPTVLTTSAHAPVDLVFVSAGRSRWDPRVYEIEAVVTPRWNPEVHQVLRGAGHDASDAVTDLETQLLVWIAQ